MKNLYKKIHSAWESYMEWSHMNMLGNIVVTVVMAIIFIFISVTIFTKIYASGSGSGDVVTDDSLSETSSTQNDNCNVYGINLHGSILTYIPLHADGDTFFDYDVVSSEGIYQVLYQANINPKIKAIMIEVDSGGGSAVAGEEISNAVKNSSKPVVAYIRGMGASSAYWAISSADKIFASKNSDVGSIGVTSSYLSNAEKNKKDGYIFEQLSSGKYKDSGNPDKILTADERALYMRDINIIYNNFVQAISENRNIPIAKVKSFSDGSTVLGEKAKELGLIDEIGGMGEVEKYLTGKIGEKPTTCW